MRVEVRHERMRSDEDVDEGATEALWALLLPLLRDVDNLLQQFSGEEIYLASRDRDDKFQSSVPL